MRVFVAGVATESNTFSPMVIDLAAFKASLYAPPGEHPATPTLCTSPLTEARRRAAAEGFTLVEGTTAWADPAGIVNQRTWETLRDQILAELRAALPVNAVILCLHGAMVAAGCEDPEGELLGAVRALVGPEVVVAAGLDPHSHLTPARVAAADILVAFKEFPHTDFVRCGAAVVDLALRAARRQIRPAISTFDCRMIDLFPSTREPMRSFVRRMRALEAAGAALSVSLIHGFMAGDVPHMGTRVLVVSDDDRAGGDRLARQLGLEVFAMRGRSAPVFVDENEAIDQARALIAAGAGPVVIADAWDNPGGGVPGDSTVILRELLRRGVAGVAFGTIWDPVAVALCHAAGEGARLPLRFGAKSMPGTGEPIDAVVRVERTVRAATQRFGASVVPIGDAAVVALDGVAVVLNTVRAQVFDPTLFTELGIDLAARDLIVVKSTNHFHAAFSALTPHIVYCSAGRPYPNDPATNAYRRAPPAIWPRVADPHGSGEGA